MWDSFLVGELLGQKICTFKNVSRPYQSDIQEDLY